jgi:hypothetical protein
MISCAERPYHYRHYPTLIPPLQYRNTARLPKYRRSTADPRGYCLPSSHPPVPPHQPTDPATSPIYLAKARIRFRFDDIMHGIT